MNIKDKAKPYTWEVGKGWYPLLNKLVSDLLAAGWDGELSQVKEKFGGLRFYIGSGSDEVHNLIYNAERESYQTCEQCGQPGVVRGGGWLKTLCDEHAGDREKTEFKY